MARPVRKINVVNEGAFVMAYDLTIFDLDIGQELTFNGFRSGEFPVGSNQVVDLIGQLDLPAGTFVKPNVHAAAGTDKEADLFVQVADNDQTATYEAHGTTFSISIKLI